LRAVTACYGLVAFARDNGRSKAARGSPVSGQWRIFRAGTLDGVSTTVSGDQPTPSGTRQGFFRALLDRFGHLIHEMGKFGAVGGISFLVDIVLFNFAVGALGMERLTAKTFSTVVAASIAFVGNRFWTWRHRERSGLAREYGLYFFFNAVGLGIGLGCLAVSHYGLGAIWPSAFKSLLADNISANLVGTALGTLFRFWAYRRFVFGGPVAQDVNTGATKSD
jgi:putative flippase GtrA